MTAILRTARLVIAPLSDPDREALAALLLDEQIKRTYMIPDFDSEEALGRMTDRFIALSLSDDRFVRGIFRAGELIGFVNDVEQKDGCLELGYVIHPAHWGRGYATEMLRAVMQELLSGAVAVIRTGAFAENLASLRVMEKCGMRRCAETEIVAYRGVQHTCVYYEKRA